MNQPQFHLKARAEFERSALFYDGKFPGLGLEFATAVQTAVAFAFSHPDAGAPVADGFRRVVVRRFPYSVVYRAKGDQYLHHSRDPSAATPELLE